MEQKIKQDIFIPIGKNIRRVRKSRKIGQTELVRQLQLLGIDMTRETLVKIERGCLLYTSVSSTGIYCRPVCNAKMPKKDNCIFYKSAAEAEVNGYRPCLICRPELAPGNAKVDSSHQILKKL